MVRRHGYKWYPFSTEAHLGIFCDPWGSVLVSEQWSCELLSQIQLNSQYYDDEVNQPAGLA